MRLRRRLFGFSFVRSAAWMVGSLAPAAACLLLTLVIFNSHNGVHVGTVRPMMLASNLNEAAFMLDGFADKQNHWSSVTFDSTNRSGSGSITGSFRH
jgi:hypothetical protein